MSTERKNVPLTMLVTASEAERLKELAWRQKRPVSGWLRSVALDAAKVLSRKLANPE
jgi:hypothetical protein